MYKSTYLFHFLENDYLHDKLRNSDIFLSKNSSKNIIITIQASMLFKNRKSEFFTS